MGDERRDLHLTGRPRRPRRRGPLAAPNPASFHQQGQAAGQITGFFPDGQLFMNLEILSTRVVPEPSGWLFLAVMFPVGALTAFILFRPRAN